MSDTRLVAYAPNGSSLGVLPAPQSLDASFAMNDVGALTFTYPLASPKSDVLGQPLEIVVQVSNDDGATWAEPAGGRFLLWRDGSDPVKADAYQVSCPSYVQRLVKAVVPFTGLGSDGQRTFTAATPGKILNDLLTEAQARGALSGLSWSFSATTDSAGVAWPNATKQTVGYSPGGDFLGILSGLAEAGLVDYRTNGRELQLYVADTATGMAADRTVLADAVTVRLGRDLIEAPTDRTWEGLADTAYVQGDGNATLIKTSGSAITPWGRQETFATASGVTDPGTLDTVASGVLQQTNLARVSYTYGLAFQTAKFKPFRDYSPGEWIFAVASNDVAPTRLKVRQITLTRDSSGITAGNVVLNDRFLENDIRVARKLARITGNATIGGGGGTPGGVGSDILPPAQVLGVGGTSNAYLDLHADVKATINLDWLDVTTNSDGTPLSDLDHYSVQRRRSGETAWTTIATVPQSYWSASPYEPNEAWEFRIWAVDSANNAGAFSAVYAITTAADATGPIQTSTPYATPAPGGDSAAGSILIVWDGKSSTAGAMDTDLAYVEVHVSTTNGFTPTGASTTTLKGTFRPGGGSLTVGALTPGATYYVKLLGRDTSNNYGALASAQAVVIARRVSDGVAPTIPGGWAPTLQPFAIGALEASWPAVANVDPVTYDVYVAAGAPVAVFNSTTQVGSTSATRMAITALPGGVALSPTVDYYLAVRVRDADGTASTTGTAGPTRYRKADVATISADWAYLGKVEATQIKSGTMEADLAVVGSIYTALTGRRVMLSDTGLVMYDDTENLVISMPTTLGSDIVLNGNVQAKSLISSGNASFLGVQNNFGPKARVTLQAGYGPPDTLAAADNSWPYAVLPNQPPVDDFYGFAIQGQATLYPTSGNILHAYSAVDGVTPDAYLSNWYLTERNPTTGAVATTYMNGLRPYASAAKVSAGNDWRLLGAVRIGSDLFCLVRGAWEPSSDTFADRKFYVEKRPVSNPATLTSKWDINTTLGVADWNMDNVVMNLDGSNLIIGWRNLGGANTRFGTYNPTTGATVISDVALSSFVTPASCRPVSINKTTADLGASSVVVITRDIDGNLPRLNVYSAAGSRTVNAEWPLAAKEVSTWYSGGAWYATYDGAYGADGIRTYDGDYWSGALTRSESVSYTWYDGDTTGGSLQHESSQSPVATIVAKKRARLRITTPPIPADPSPTEYDDPDRVRIYTGTAGGSRTTQYLRTTTPVGVNTASIANRLATVTNPPNPLSNPNAFVGSLGAILQPETSTAWALRGDGSGQVGPFAWSGTGADLNDTGWVNLTLDSGQSAPAGQTPRIRKVNGLVILEGQIQKTTGSWTASTATSLISTTPILAAYRPLKRVDVIAAGNGAASGKLTLDTNGSLTLNLGTTVPTFISLSGLVFRAD